MRKITVSCLDEKRAIMNMLEEAKMRQIDIPAVKMEKMSICRIKYPPSWALLDNRFYDEIKVRDRKEVFFEAADNDLSIEQIYLKYFRASANMKREMNS